MYESRWAARQVSHNQAMRILVGHNPGLRGALSRLLAHGRRHAQGADGIYDPREP
jgi:hypothetical protein